MKFAFFDILFKIGEEQVKNIPLSVEFEPTSPRFRDRWLDHFDDDSLISLTTFLSILVLYVSTLNRVQGLLYTFAGLSRMHES